MRESFAALRGLLSKVEATVFRCEAEEHFHLLPDYGKDFEEFSNLLVLAYEVFSQPDDLSEQFNTIYRQTLSSLDVARFIFDKGEISHHSMASTLAKVHGDIVQYHLQTLSLFIELKLYSPGQVSESTWEKICF